MKQLTLDALASDLVCPVCKESALQCRKDPQETIHCRTCNRSFPVSAGIPNFLLHELLDETNRNELDGNHYDVSNQQAVAAATTKLDWSPAYIHSLIYAMEKVRVGIRKHVSSSCTELCSLGSGTGFELKWLCRELSFSRVYSSDISPSAVSLVPVTLEDVQLPVGLFVSEFLNVPMAKTEKRLGLVFQALHHTSDIHIALDSLLRNNFSTLVVVEPTTNWLIEFLAKFGLAKRVEYSGLNPSWLKLSEAKRIADEHQCGVNIKTWWEIPPYLSTHFDRRPMARKMLTKFMDLFSSLTNFFSFGSMSCVVFVRHNKTVK